MFIVGMLGGVKWQIVNTYSGTCYNGHTRDWTKWPLCTGDRYRRVGYNMGSLVGSVSVKASAYGIGGRPAASPRFPLPLKKSAYGQTRKMRPENGQI